MSHTNQETIHIHHTIQHLAACQEIFLQAGDEDRSLKVERLAKKLNDREFILAFCGHFSAGKSTMINHLMGEEILPSSPIPTSANLVKVHQSQEDFAKVHYHHDKPLYFKEPYDFSTIKDFCKNGEEVYSIEIGRSRGDMPEGVSVLDTPGVDSTDDAHKLSTESAIHLADAVFYVMDYNHVQSQVNFEFTRELTRHGVKLYLVINQIDKHQEEELTFSQFKEGVKNSFAAWGVIPDQFFFTSLKNSQYPENDLTHLEQLIHEQVQHKEDLMERSAEAAISQLIDEHEQWFNEQLDSIIENGKDVLTEQDWENKESLLQEEKDLMEKLHENNVQFAKKQFEEERSKILKNAYLMPFEIRDLAKEFLESRQSDFKVGFLFSKGKTEEEKSARLNRFMDELNNQIQSQIDWHLKTLGKSFLKQYNLSSSEFVTVWDQLSLEVKGQYLIGLIKPGAKVNGDYVLQYCDNLAEDIKKQARMLTNELMDRMLQDIKNQTEGKNRAQEAKLHQLQKKTAYLYKWILIDEEKRNQLNNLINLQMPYSNSLNNTIQNWKDKWYEQETEYRVVSEFKPKVEIEPDKTKVKETIVQPAQNETPSLENVINRLESMTNVFRNTKGFSNMADILDRKKKRLSNQSFTIALFGAFSAGKSSFANALLGKKVLPVSPNPTTASINRIMPVSENHYHETADVKIKSREQLFQDISHSLSHFNQSISGLKEAIEIIPTLLEKEDGNGKEKVHLSFLKAFYDGYERFQSLLGSTVNANLQQYQGFVADETQSCFVESIDLYYDCDVTRQGITLVDTPGADSINARHTGVAFEYIKDADAILFVTYYNHAFAKADREFLIQLGRVKDTFELDKMFFVVNAIDLAKDDEEKQEVLSYVESQLVQYGIRFPRIYGVSSLQALKNPNDSNSGLNIFQEDFQSFIQNELVSMSVKSALNEWERGVKRFEHFIDMASSDKNNKKVKIQKLMEAKSNLTLLIAKRTTESLEIEIHQEVSELVHYVKQRVFYRVSDFYKEAFHSGLFVKYSNHSIAIEEGIKEFIHSIGFDLSQEMRATSLRVEQYIQNQLDFHWNELEEHIKEWEMDIVLSPQDVEAAKTIQFDNAFKNEDIGYFEKAFTSFKNPKQFFEKGGKKSIQEKLEQLLSEPTDEYLNNEKDRLNNWGSDYLNKQFNRMKDEITHQVNDQINANIDALETVQDIKKLQRNFEILKNSK
ncbi:dynamin family protein [Rossellomorea aquimaris]|uniref:dynamin family protein n=1 Tax=Rossellomorea aquimaris TaxID=189382 RepID=UPI0007D066AB|nr:dynamin family protein [Rossellomorea aquimaris]